MIKDKQDNDSILHYSVYKVVSYIDDENCWCWQNDSYICQFTATSDINIKEKFMRELKKHGITFGYGKILILVDYKLLQVVDRKTKKPLFSAQLNRTTRRIKKTSKKQPSYVDLDILELLYP